MSEENDVSSPSSTGQSPAIRENALQSRVRNLLLSVIALFCAGSILVYAKSVILPILIAFFAMILILPLVEWLNRRVPAWVAIPTALLLVGLGFLAMGLTFYANLGPITRAIPRYRERGRVLIERGSEKLQSLGLRDEIPRLLAKEEGGLDDLVDPGAVARFLTGGVTTFFAFLGKGVLVLLILLFMLIEATRFQQKAGKAFGPDSPIFDTMRCISADVQTYVKWKTLISLVTGALTAILCALFGVDFPLFWGIMAFGLNYIPNIGSVIASILPALLALFQFDSPLTALGLLACLVTMQQVLGAVVEPKLMGESLSISPLLLLLSLVFWGFLWGVVGMILAVPIAVTIKIVCQHVDPLKPAAILFES
jgi:predicted PurR-regulated permease PerM